MFSLQPLRPFLSFYPSFSVHFNLCQCAACLLGVKTEPDLARGSVFLCSIRREMPQQQPEFCIFFVLQHHSCETASKSLSSVTCRAAWACLLPLLHLPFTGFAYTLSRIILKACYYIFLRCFHYLCFLFCFGFLILSPFSLMPSDPLILALCYVISMLFTTCSAIVLMKLVNEMKPVYEPP